MSLLRRLFGSQERDYADIGAVLGKWAATSKGQESGCEDYAQTYSLDDRERQRLFYGFSIVRLHLVGHAAMQVFPGNSAAMGVVCKTAGQSFAETMLSLPTPTIDVADFAATGGELAFLFREIPNSGRTLPIGAICGLLCGFRQPEYFEDFMRAVQDLSSFPGRLLTWYVADRFRQQVSNRTFPADTQLRQRGELATLSALASMEAVSLAKADS